MKRLGIVSFLNSRPLIAGLAGAPDVDLLYDVPAALEDWLVEGNVDAALVQRSLQIPGLVVRQAPEPADAEPVHDSSCSQSQVSRFSLMRRRNSTAVEPSNARWSQVNPR